MPYSETLFRQVILTAVDYSMSVWGWFMVSALRWWLEIMTVQLSVTKDVVRMQTRTSTPPRVCV